MAIALINIFRVFMDLINIFKIIEKKEDFESGIPANGDQIDFFEKKLNVTFPDSYVQFLKQFGYATWSEGEIYGLSENPYYDLLMSNKEAREENVPNDFISLPRDAFIFKEYGGGGYYMLFGADSPRAGQVGLFLSETGYQEEQTWDSFEAFLEDYYCS